MAVGPLNKFFRKFFGNFRVGLYYCLSCKKFFGNFWENLKVVFTLCNFHHIILWVSPKKYFSITSFMG